MLWRRSLKKAKKGITIPFWVRLSLDIYVYYGTTLTIVRVRVVVHKFLRKNCADPKVGKSTTVSHYIKNSEKCQ